jgi:hypothetical protein
VVVMARAAPAVQQLPVLVAQGVDLPVVHEDLQVPVHGGQAHRAAATAQDVMDLLSAAERVGLPHGLADDVTTP